MQPVDWATLSGAGGADWGAFSPPQESLMRPAPGAPAPAAPSSASVAGPACLDPRWPAAPHDDAHPLYASDEFRIQGFKVVACAKSYQHDYTTCPFAHPGEKALRRDPRSGIYTGIACPDMKKTGLCHRGDRCYACHSVFEYWLHPTRYRTQMCNDGLHCARRICFFAHSPAELRSGAPKPALPADAAAGLAADAAGRAARAGAAAAAAAHRAGGGSLPAGLGLGLGWGLPLSPTAGGAGRPSASLSFAPPRPAGPLSVSTSSEDSGGGCGCGSGGSGGSRTPAADAPSAPSRPRARGARGGARARAAAARAAAAAAGAGAKGGGGRPPFAVGSWDGGLGGSVWGWDGPDALRSASTSLGGLSLMSGGGCCGGGDGSLAAAADLAADLRSASLGAAPGPFFRSPPLRRSAFEAPRPLSAAVAAPPPGGRASWGGGNQQQWASGGGGGGGGGGPWQCLQTHNAHHTPHPLLGAPAAAPRPSRASADFPDAPDARSLDLVGAAALEAEASRRHSASLAGRGGVPPRHLSTRVTTPPSPSPPDADDGTAPVSLRLASLRLQVAMAEDEEARAALLEASGPPPRPGAAGGWGGARQYHPHPHPHPALVGAAAPAARPQPALASISLDEARRVRAFLAAGSVTGAAGGPAGGRG